MKKILVVIVAILCVAMLASCTQGLLNQVEEKLNDPQTKEQIEQVVGQLNEKAQEGKAALEEKLGEELPISEPVPSLSPEDVDSYADLDLQLEQVFSEEEASKGIKAALEAQNAKEFTDAYAKVSGNDLTIFYVTTFNKVDMVSGLSKTIDEAATEIKNMYETMLAQRLMFIPVNFKLTVLDKNEKEIYSTAPIVLDTEKMKQMAKDGSAQGFALAEEQQKTAQEYVDMLNTPEMQAKQQEMLGGDLTIKYSLDKNNIIAEYNYNSDLGLTKADFKVEKSEEDAMFASWIAEVAMMVKDAKNYTLVQKYVDKGTGEVMYEGSRPVK